MTEPATPAPDQDVVLDAEVYRLIRNWQDRHPRPKDLLDAVVLALEPEYGKEAVMASVRRVLRRLIESAD